MQPVILTACLLVAQTGVGQTMEPTLTVVADLAQPDVAAKCKRTLECAVGAQTTGGVTQRGIFQHPLSEGEAALPIQVRLPHCPAGARLLLVTDIGLRDGAGIEDQRARFNGVGFAVDVGGERLLQEAVLDFGWRRRTVDLAPYAGKTVELVLVTNCNGEGNANYDWAIWGRPRILLLRGDVSARLRRAGSVGVVALDYEVTGQPAQGAAVKVVGRRRGRPSGKPVSVPLSRVARTEEGGAGLAILDYDFSDQPGLQSLRVEAPEGLTVRKLTAHEYLPAPRIVSLSPASALVFAGRPFEIVAQVRNDSPAPSAEDEYIVWWRLGGSWRGPDDLRHGPPFTRVPAVPAGGTATVRHEFEAEPPGTLISAALAGPGEPQIVDRFVRVRPGLPDLPAEAPERAEAAFTEHVILLQNSRCRIAFVRGENTEADYAAFYLRGGEGWELVAATDGLAQCHLADEDAPRAVVLHEARVGQQNGAASVVFTGTVGGVDAALAEATLSFKLTDGAERVHVRYELTAGKQLDILRFRGPWLYVGDNSFGTEKRFALFPGLEYLSAEERSSSDRDVIPEKAERTTPQPYKVTVPLMAVECGAGLVGLVWDQKQRWDGEHWSLSPRFASPNFLEGQDNHLLGLFLPSVPDYVPENAPRAEQPYRLEAGKKLRLEAQIVLMPGGGILDAVPQWYEAYGFPDPLEPPRSFEQELALSRHGFMVTVWDKESKGFRHCVDWAPGLMPGYCALLWQDAHLSTDGSRDEVLERIRTHTDRILREQGAQALASGAGCHILRFELPFHYGYLREGLAGARAQAYGLVESMDEDGGRRFRPDERRKKLGETGDTAVGLCAHGAWTMLKYARISGDQECAEAGKKALAFMDRFTVPRGAQTWECPLREPDILASAWALAAYLEAYRIFGDQHYLDQAVYWAKTGLPFCFAWYQEDRPGMLWATVPVFGSSFLSHTWFGVPVQWCGLVYAYHLQHLWEYDQSLPWLEVARGITISGMYQQFGDEEPKLKGTYPDGFYGDCTKRSPPYINPEDIILNVLALHGHDPDVQTRMVETPEGRVTVSSGARVTSAELTDGALTVRLEYHQGAASHALVAGLSEPAAVHADGAELGRRTALEEAESGWSWDQENERLFVKAAHGKRPVDLRVELGRE